jgi:hypothetical protein
MAIATMTTPMPMPMMATVQATSEDVDDSEVTSVCQSGDAVEHKSRANFRCPAHAGSS